MITALDTWSLQLYMYSYMTGYITNYMTRYSILHAILHAFTWNYMGFVLVCTSLTRLCGPDARLAPCRNQSGQERAAFGSFQALASGDGDGI
jgi:hypothetical protein